MAQPELEFDGPKGLAPSQLDTPGNLEADHNQWEVNLPQKLNRVDVVRSRGHLSLLRSGVTLAEGNQAFDHWVRNEEGQSGLPDPASGYYDLARVAQKEARREAEEGVEPPSPFPLI